MNTTELLAQINRLLALGKKTKPEASPVLGFGAEVLEFLRTFAGPKSSFFLEAMAAARFSPSYKLQTLDAILLAFKRYLEAGLKDAITPQRRAELDVVSDILGQAGRLLADTKTHPAAAATLIGATLEEFLRTWVESVGLSMGSARPGLDAYAKALLAASLINKQDMKDITGWAGCRNDAAHGLWAQVADRDRIRLMLEGVNLFMRRYGA